MEVLDKLQWSLTLPVPFTGMVSSLKDFTNKCGLSYDAFAINLASFIFATEFLKIVL